MVKACKIKGKLKCWNKIHQGPKMTRFEHIKNKNQVEVYSKTIDGRKIHFYDVITKTKILAGSESNSKSIALNKANKYMKKHNKC